MKITIEIPQKIVEEYMEAHSQEVGEPEEIIKEEIKKHINQSISSNRMRKAMEKRREEMEEMREIGKKEVEW